MHRILLAAIITAFQAAHAGDIPAGQALYTGVTLYLFGETPVYTVTCTTPDGDALVKDQDGGAHIMSTRHADGVLVLMNYTARSNDKALKTKARTPCHEGATASAANASEIEALRRAKYTRALGHLWSDVMLYHGPNKTPVGVAECFHEGIVGVRMATSGQLQPKDRRAITGGDWYVMDDDPAITRRDYRPCR